MGGSYSRNLLETHQSSIESREVLKTGETKPMRKRRLLKKLLSGSKNIRFSEATACAEAFGFKLARIRDSHPIYLHPDVPELVLPQINSDGALAWVSFCLKGVLECWSIGVLGPHPSVTPALQSSSRALPIKTSWEEH